MVVIVVVWMKVYDLFYDVLCYGDVVDFLWLSESFDVVFSYGLFDWVDDLE